MIKMNWKKRFTTTKIVVGCKVELIEVDEEDISNGLTDEDVGTIYTVKRHDGATEDGRQVWYMEERNNRMGLEYIFYEPQLRRVPG